MKWNFKYFIFEELKFVKIIAYWWDVIGKYWNHVWKDYDVDILLYNFNIELEME